MASHYIALIHKDSDSGCGVSFPDLLGVTTVADTLDDALREASVVLAFALEDWPGGAPGRERSMPCAAIRPSSIGRPMRSSPPSIRTFR